MRYIVALSGGLGSAWCADWALKNYPKKDVIFYFNDVKWEHEDLYRFLDDIENKLGHPITRDNDGRSPEQLFKDNRALANNRMPFCSRILKAERLQNFYNDGDVLVFGIGPEEEHRAHRIVGAYQKIAAKNGKFPKLQFPLIENNVTKYDTVELISKLGIAIPKLYKLGFSHNNCSGGCVRAGKKSWMLLYKKLPEVYAERERVEKEMRDYLGKDIHILKDETLEHFRGRIDSGNLSKHYETLEEPLFECFGVCDLMA